ncbi:MAG: UvrB/UvrC motif-containing protein [Chlamydiae bacterium]|nr:UvrB/UvrC motif-containing protein [Chlamydiota bacterium]
MAERPVECGNCKKPAKVFYKEMVSNSIVCTEMCNDCPILEQKLHGSLTINGEDQSQIAAGLYCGRCHTGLDTIKMGNPVGCSECYNVFGDLLVSELIEENKVPTKLKKDLSIRKNQPIHIGKSPGKQMVIPSSNRLTSLNEALNEALKKENYEEAAWIRDQIKELMGKSKGPFTNEGKS